MVKDELGWDGYTNMLLRVHHTIHGDTGRKPKKRNWTELVGGFRVGH